MIISKQKTKFETYSLINYEIINCNFLTKISLSKLKIYSNNAIIQKEKSKPFIITYNIPYFNLVSNITPISQNIQHLEPNNDISIEFFFSEDDILGIFHNTEYSQILMNNTTKSKVFFILKKINYKVSFIDKRYNTQKSVGLFLYKNFVNEIENLEYLNFVVKVSLPLTVLIEVMLTQNYTSKFLLGNEEYANNILIINEIEESMTDVLLKKYSSIDQDIIWLFFCFVSSYIISYIEMINFLNTYQEDIDSLYQKNKEHLYGAMLMILSKFKKDEITGFTLLNKKGLLDQLLENFTNYSSPDHTEFQMIKNIIITPLYTFFNVIKYNTNQNVDSNKHLIQVNISQGKNEKIVEQNKFTKAYYMTFLQRGIKVQNIFYTFFTFSKNYSKQFFIWFKNENCKDNIQLDNLIDIINLEPNTLKCIIKPKKILKKEEYPTKGINQLLLSNKCSPISENLLKSITIQLGLENNPSCIIGKYCDLQGVWSLYDNDKSNLYYRTSMGTINLSKNSDIIIYDSSKYKKGYLTRQMIGLFNYLGVPSQLFINLIKENLSTFLISPSALGFFNLKFIDNIYKFFNKSWNTKTINDNFFSSLNKSLIFQGKNKFVKKGLLSLNNSAILKGVVDEYNILKENHIFVIISPSNSYEDVNNIHLDGKGVICPFPCFDPHNIKIVKFVKYDEKKLNENNLSYYKKICKLVNVIVFPSKGENSLLNELGCDHFFGAEFLVIWDTLIRKSIKEEPISESKTPNNVLSQDRIIENGINILFQNLTKKLEIDQLALLDSNLRKNEDDQKLFKKITNMLKNAHSFPNTNKNLSLLQELKKKTEFPHYLKEISQKNKNFKKFYHSSKILGKIFDITSDFFFQKQKMKIIEEKEDFLDYKNLGKNLLLENNEFSPLTFFYLSSIIFILEILNDYNSFLNEIMNQINVNSYNEFFLQEKWRKKVSPIYLSIIEKKYFAKIDEISKKIEDILGYHFDQPFLMAYYDKQNILAIIAYNITFHLQKVENIINNQLPAFQYVLQHNINDFLEEINDYRMSFENENDIYEYHQLSFGLLNTLIYPENYNYNMIKNVKNEEKDIQYIRLLINKIKNDKYKINCFFPYIFFCDNIISIKQIK